MSKLRYTLEEGHLHSFDFQNLKIHLTEINGNDIGSEGGLRFTMSLKEGINGKETLEKVDEFVIYPDAIDWKNGGKMKPEFEKRIKELQGKITEPTKDDQMPVSPPYKGKDKEPSHD